jgi:hypothetical protein
MRRYNFKRAKEIIEKEKYNGLVFAEMGIEEDLFYTADKVWDPENLYSDDFLDGKIAGISGSEWGTPILSLYYEEENKILRIFIEED